MVWYIYEDCSSVNMTVQTTVVHVDKVVVSKLVACKVTLTIQAI